jgi:serine/threonine-protein kinase RsbW
MNTAATETDGECLTLESKLSEIARVPPWIEELAARHGIPNQIQFAMDLCLEEILSNIIRHGYASEPNHALVIRHRINREGSFTLIVEDQAPQFNPLLVSDPPVPHSLEDVSGGGHGIQLLKQFADAIEYERMSNGNRITVTFIAHGSTQADPRTTTT